MQFGADVQGGDEVQHEVAMDGLKNNSDKVHEEKDRKMARLQQLAFLSNQQSTNHSEIAESNRRKAEQFQKIANNATMIEGVQGEVKELHSRIDVFETKFREAENRHKEVSGSMEKQRKMLESMIQDKCEVLAVAIKFEEENRVRLGQELQQMVRLREQKLKQALLNELNEEANSRMLVSADVIKLAEEIKDSKIQMDDEVAKIQAKITNWSMKFKSQLSDGNDQLKSENILRERADSALRNDFEQKIKEMKNSFEVKAMETDLEQDAVLHRMSAEISLLQQHLEVSKAQAKDLVEDLETSHVKKMVDADVALNTRIENVIQQIDDRTQQSLTRHVEIKGEMKKECADRKRSLNLLQEELAREHLRREQDESAIINMLDTFMRQVKDMNSLVA